MNLKSLAIGAVLLGAFALTLNAQSNCDKNDYLYFWESSTKQNCISRAVAIVQEKTGKRVGDSSNWDIYRNTFERFTALLDKNNRGSGSTNNVKNYTECTRDSRSLRWKGKVFVCIRN